MAGSNTFTTEMDIYAFAISCIEILMMGRLPWPYMNDEDVRHQVLSSSFPLLLDTVSLIVAL